MSRFLIPILILVLLKVYFYYFFWKLFERKSYKLGVGLLGIVSFASTFMATYAMNTIMTEGVIRLPLWINLSFGLMITFLVSELVVAPFFYWIIL